MSDRHPIFKRFPYYAGPLPEGHVVDWLGARFLPVWTGTPPTTAEDRYPGIPFSGDEEFEWIDLLEAVCAAEGSFTMLELGAGYGRWGIRGALAAKRLGISHIDIRFVEGDPQHAAWIYEGITLNRLGDVRTTVIEAALCYAGTQVPFTIDLQVSGLNSKNWYGQAIGGVSLEHQTNEIYFGRKIYREAGQYGHIFIDSITLEELIEDIDYVDYIDADLQGAEHDLICRSLDTLSRKVRFVHIGTHSLSIERDLREAFANAGWVPRWDFTLQARQDTPYGQVHFGDGVQSWMNPRLL
jgi:hypothetical protein